MSFRHHKSHVYGWISNFDTLTKILLDKDQTFNPIDKGGCLGSN